MHRLSFIAEFVIAAVLATGIVWAAGERIELRSQSSTPEPARVQQIDFIQPSGDVREYDSALPTGALAPTAESDAVATQGSDRMVVVDRLTKTPSGAQVTPGGGEGKPVEDGEVVVQRDGGDVVIPRDSGTTEKPAKKPEANMPPAKKPDTDKPVEKPKQPAVDTSKIVIGLVGDIDIPESVKARAQNGGLDLLARESARCDFLIVSYHWGRAGSAKPDVLMREIAYMLAKAGADAIFGHGPHVVQEVQLIGGVPVAFSLGDFIWHTDKKSALLELVLVEKDGKLVIRTARLHECELRGGLPVLTGSSTAIIGE